MPGVVAVIDDLFFVSKVQETARQVGLQLTTVRAADFRLESLRHQKPVLIVVDLMNQSANSVQLIHQLKNDGELGGVPVVAFGRHTEVALLEAARQAGAEQVMPRSEFAPKLPQLLRQFTASTAPVAEN